jgi:predicted N-formylglutamate amidohydrolase
MQNFEVIDNSATSSVIIHVPHGGTWIPDDCRSDFLLNGDALESEAKLMADLDTLALARGVYASTQARPSMFLNQVSRLVFDPERFDDESEEMNAVGMGVLYTKTSDQKPLRTLSAEREAELKSRFYAPYAQSLASLVNKALLVHKEVTIIDLHSYAVEALPYELHKDKARPALCIGVDSFHTPENLISRVKRSFKNLGSIAINEPFSGTYVPLEHYGKRADMQSVMLEIRKDLLAREGALLQANAIQLIESIESKS